jgi:tRNA(Arg) A34 adenosine deaminase TadA
VKINLNLIDILLKTAEANGEYPRAKLASALVKDNRVISIGINRRKTDPLQAKYGKNHDSIHMHAEIHAIKNALNRHPVSYIRGSILYVCRVKRKNQKTSDFVPALAKPCEGCARAIAEFGIKSVVYTTNKGTIDII